MMRLLKSLTLILMMTFALSACGGGEATPADEAAPAGNDGGQQADAPAAAADDSDSMDSMSDAPYPTQFATIGDYTEATGGAIGSFQEAPMLADMVSSGDLPPLDERLPLDPAVVQPLVRPGVYGGELAGPSTNPTCCGWDVLEMRLQKLLTIDTDLKTIIPNVAKGIDISADQTEFTIHLREGHRWSDGELFTAEDFRFYIEDILGNEELTPSIPGLWKKGGELVQV
ncbi:MAG: ABC transporter substrate-binding protein, partial [Chloroflexota bacterium]